MYLNHGLIELPKTMDGREWLLHLMFLKPWMGEGGFFI